MGEPLSGGESKIRVRDVRCHLQSATSSKKKIEHHRTERYRQRPFSSGLGRRMPVMNYAGPVIYDATSARWKAPSQIAKATSPW